MKIEPIAIVGIGAILPGAEQFVDFWNNSLDMKCFVREIPEEFWEKELFYDKDPLAEDKTYSKNAGVVGNVEFNPMEFGIPPKSMQSISVEQIYGLVVTRQALIDAKLYGKGAKAYDKTRTGVIMSASVGKTAYQLSNRTNAPLFESFMRNCNISEDVIQEVITNYKNGMQGWSEASNPGYLANVVSGRIANRFDFKGTSCSVDAACASSLAAVKFACQELLIGDCDIMVTGGVNLDLTNTTFVSFCKTPAISKSDSIHPFDKDADGMILGDGTGAIVLKRLSTAEADHDKIYALIEGIGSSSDGQEKSIFSPNQSGQVLAIKRALEKAEVKPEQIGLIEAHGTGTLIGDECEVRSMSEVFDVTDSKERRIVLSGCKGQIGHLRLSAGIASLIHAALAVYHKQFLPVTGCREMSDVLKDSIFHICKQPMPWIVNQKQEERCAVVSAFGFGGTNYSLVLKEYQSEHHEAYRYTTIPRGILLEAPSKDELIYELQNFIKNVKELKENFLKAEYTYRKLNDSYVHIGFVACTSEESIEKAEFAIKMLGKNINDVWNLKGVLYVNSGWTRMYKVTALFSGQGSQYCHMLSDIAGAYPELREAITIADNELLCNGKKPISEIIYSKAWTKEEKDAKETLLRQTQNTQLALACIEVGLYEALRTRGFEPDICIGHSFGELVALYAAGAFDKSSLMRLAYVRSNGMAQCSAKQTSTGMMAVKADAQTVKTLITDIKDLYIANQNSPTQIIVAGSESALEELYGKEKTTGIKMHRLNVSAAFHTPYMDNAKDQLRNEIKNTILHQIKKTVISNYTAQEYSNVNDISQNLTEQLVNTVLFEESIKNAYKQGSRVFVELGPGSVLKGLVDSCLKGKEDIITLTTDSKENSLVQFETTIVALAALGLPMREDCYEKHLSEEVIVKKKKNTYSVPPTFFLLPDERKRMKEAKNHKRESRLNRVEDFGDYCDNLTNVTNKQKEIEERKEADDMNKYESMYEIQKVNAKVIEDYVKFQSKQFEQVKELLQSNFVETEGNRKLLFDYVTNFQANCTDAIRAYFKGQDSIVDQDDETTDYTITVSNEEKPIMKDEAKIDGSSEIEREASKSTRAKIERLVIETIASITGYPDDMLEGDMSLEGDLGVDSIKRLELFSNINEKLGNIFGQDDMVALTVVQTIDECIDIIQSIKEDPNHVAWSEEDIEVAKSQI